ncbi:MAG TPA: cation transporter [Egibacteraceae bacterium]|nr:cation transporter [Actinomycetota bacterium]HWB71003.1 cation transporter [Egibacteraceae bacterium]
MTSDTLTVPEIHCQHCKQSIEGALQALDGVERAEVDVAAKTVTVTYDVPTDRAALIGAIEDQGYEVPAQ